MQYDPTTTADVDMQDQIQSPPPRQSGEHARLTSPQLESEPNPPSSVPSPQPVPQVHEVPSTKKFKLPFPSRLTRRESEEERPHSYESPEQDNSPARLTVTSVSQESSPAHRPLARPRFGAQ